MLFRTSRCYYFPAGGDHAGKYRLQVVVYCIIWYHGGQGRPWYLFLRYLKMFNTCLDNRFHWHAAGPL
jgi:hypothetical protein